MTVGDAEVGVSASRIWCDIVELAGDRASAIRVYDEHMAMLRHEYDLEPSAETTALAESIRQAPDRTGVKPILHDGVTARRSVEPGSAARISVDILVVRPRESVDESGAADASQLSDRRVGSRRHYALRSRGR